jgi:predicted nucleic acid-binding protein
MLVYGEVIEYIRGMWNYPTLRVQLRRHLIDVRPYILTYAIMERYAQLRRAMRSHGGLIGDVDTLIASTAPEVNLIVVTLDSHFARVPGLSAQIIAGP